MSVELGSFDAIIGMDWLAKYQANPGKCTRLNIISCTKTHEYKEKGFLSFWHKLLQKRLKTKSERSDLRRTHRFKTFLSIPEDLAVLPPTRQVESKMIWYHGASPVARAPYRLRLRKKNEGVIGQLKSLIIEYFVKISEKARILELKRRNLKNIVLTFYTPYASRKIRRICACTSQETTKIYTPYPEDFIRRVDITAKTRRPQAKSNRKNDRVPSASKSSWIKNKDVEVEKHQGNLLLSKNKKHISSECNNIKLAIRNDKSEVVCVMCKQWFITTNHDVRVLNYVNGMNSCNDNQSANVSNSANHKKHMPKVKKPKKSGSKERLASPRLSKPRTYVRWSPTGRILDHYGKIIESSDFECKSDTSVYDDANASNPQEPTINVFQIPLLSCKFIS
ncbi:hypothetical protein Tco_1134410 [Tanacetum coccineum]